jgi:hypothetical protein
MDHVDGPSMNDLVELDRIASPGSDADRHDAAQLLPLLEDEDLAVKRISANVGKDAKAA